MKKELRQFIYNQTKGRCGYCGNKIEYKKMQVDHIVAQRNYGNEKYTTQYKMNDIKNLLCTCRKCNHYKGALPLGVFREQILTLHERLRKQYIFEVGLNFGITQINEWHGYFLFEVLRLDKFTELSELIEIRK